MTGGHGFGKFADNDGEVQRTAKNALEIGETPAGPTFAVAELEVGYAAQHDVRDRGRVHDLQS